MNADISAGTSPQTEEQFTSLLIACDEALAAGVPAPALTDAARVSELRPRLERGVACLHLLGQVWAARSTSPVATDTSAAGPLAGKPLTRFGRFHIRRELGHGSFGSVYLAHDPLLGRDVALKIPRIPILVTPELRQRFHHEAQAAARLDHPNLVPVYEAGAVGEICFLASPYCPGMTLAAWLGQRKHPVPWRMAAKLVATLADAVQHAHSRGVLHRDLKPANILLQRDEGHGTRDEEEAGSSQIPRIIDFGLAKLLIEQQPEQTGTGVILGSPCYMAPEQAAAKNKEITTAADVYGLGATLYEMLTGRPPFLADTTLATLEKVRTQQPVPPRRLQPDIPRDLETICLKCLHKDPRRRYASAHGLAEDLRRLLAGEPIHARAVGAGERLLKWARRRPAYAVVAGVTCVAGALLFILSAAFNLRLAEEQGETKLALHREVQANADLTKANEDLTRALYFHRVSLAHHEWLANNVARTNDLLDACPRDLRQWEWRYLKGLTERGFLTCRGHTEVTRVAFDAKGKRIASSSYDGTIKIWDAATGQELTTLTGHNGRLEGVAFSRDGERVASAGWDRTVKVWDVATGKVVYNLTGHQREVNAVAFSPDGKRLASASSDKKVKLWDMSTGRLLRTLEEHPDRVYCVTFSPDGRRLATGSSNVQLWDADSGERLGICAANPVEALIWVGDVAFHRDGRRLASANGNKTIYLWDSTTFKPLQIIRGHNGGVNSVRFSPDGVRLASASHDQTVRLWDSATGAEIATLRGHAAPWVSSVDFSPDGQRLASGGQDKTVRVWDALTGQGGPTLGRQRHFQVCCSADGRLIATTGSYGDGALAVHDSATFKRTPLPGPRGSIASVAFHPDSRHLASAGANIKIWDTKTWKEVATLPGHAQPITRVVYSPDGKHLASASFDKTVKIWDPATGQVVQTLTGHEKWVSSVAFSPDGNFVASASDDKTIRIWNAATGQLLRTLRGHLHGVTSVAFDSTSKHLASGGRDATVKVWNVATGQEVHTLKGHTSVVRDVVFSPDGRRLASASHDYTVKLWDVATGEEALTLRAHIGGVNTVAFSPDGTRLYGGADGVKIWEALPAAER
jgi:eukaryotic-like serine/threonine-protein kinase